MFKLIRGDAAPLSEQIAAGLEKMIQGGELSAGARLPSVRQLASQLSVSTFTVTGGYDRLVARNVIAARPGAGYYVVASSWAGPETEEQALITPPNDPIGFALHCLDGTGASLRCGSGFLPEAWLADIVPAALVTRVAKSRNALLAPSPAQGSPGLRQQLSDRLRAVGIAAVPGQIITTVGPCCGQETRSSSKTRAMCSMRSAPAHSTSSSNRSPARPMGPTSMPWKDCSTVVRPKFS